MQPRISSTLITEALCYSGNTVNIHNGMFIFYPGLPHTSQIARKLHSGLHPMQMINHFKLDSYHNPTLFVDDEKVFVAGVKTTESPRSPKAELL